MTNTFKPVYFAHTVSLYDTALEDATVYFIADKVAGGRVEGVENPNQPHHQEGYKKYAERVKKSQKNHKGMNYFYDEVLPECGSCVAMPFLDGKVGLGVAGEVLWFIDRNLPVWYMEPKETIYIVDIDRFITSPPMSDLFTLRKFTGDEIEMLRADKDEGSELLLTHEETRLRTWQVYGEEKVDYTVAHLRPTSVYEGFYPDK